MLTFILFIFLGMLLAWNVFPSQPRWSKWMFDKGVNQWVDKLMAWLRTL